MFNPKITEGEWLYGYSKGINESILISKCNNKEFKSIFPFNKNNDDIKAITAVPELLEVYRAAKEFSEHHADDGDFNYTYGEALKPVLHTIKKLEERHCDN